MSLENPGGQGQPEMAIAARDVSLCHRMFWTIGACVVLLDAFKLLAFYSFGQAQPLLDAPGYWNFGGDVAGGDFWILNSQMSYRTPGYPWLIGLIRWMTGRWALMSLVAIQLAISMVTSFLIGWSAAKMTGSRCWGLAAYISCACGVNRAAYATAVLTETIACGLFTMTVVLLLKAITAHSQSSGFFRELKWVQLAIVSMAVGILVRPAGIVLVLPMILVLFMLPRKTIPFWIPHFCLFALISGMILGPWCWRNQELTGRFTLCNFTGRELWTATFSPWPGAELTVPAEGAGGELRQKIEKPGVAFQPEWNWIISNQLTASGMTDAEADSFMFRVAWQAVRQHPVRAIGCGMFRCITFWTCWEWPTEWDEDSPGGKTYFADQHHWVEPSLSRIGRQILEWSPGRTRWGIYLLNAFFLLNLTCLLWNNGTRRPGMVLAASVLGLNLLTAAIEIPVYRYRMVLEPIMVLTTVLAMNGWSTSRIAKSDSGDLAGGRTN